jgi:hypothetical protein
LPGSLARQAKCYGAVQPVKARSKVGSLGVVPLELIELPDVTVTELLVADPLVGEVQASNPFVPSARPLIVYRAWLVELGAVTVLPEVLSYAPTAAALAGTFTE